LSRAHSDGLAAYVRSVNVGALEPNPAKGGSTGFAREDLDRWESELGRVLPDGSFGENLTVPGVDPNAALIGEQWRIGEELVLQVTSPASPVRPSPPVWG